MLKALSPVDLGRLLWRRKPWVLLPMAAGLLAALAAIRMLPPVYRASTLILVESQKVPTNFVRTTVTSSLQERLQAIEQEIMSRSNLERIITEMGLYPELVENDQMAQAVGRVRRDLTLQLQGRSFFRVYFKGPEPKMVAEVANRIGELFIEENLRLREARAQDTSAFLEAELEDTKRRLEEQEARVARFRIEHDGTLPDQRQTNMAALAHLETKLEINLDAIENAEMRKLLLQREGVLGGGATGLSRLQELKLQLSQMRSRYTDRHPDVVRLQQEIAALEREGGLEPGSGADGGSLEDAQRAAVETEIERLQAERGRILREIESYQWRLEQIPRVEQELMSLTRDYDNIRRSYQSLLAKRIDARLAENLETRRQAEQFRILEPATPPGRPYAPNPLLLLALGLAAGGALGVGLVFLREETDQSFLDQPSLEDAFPAVPVVAVIPQIGRSSGSYAPGDEAEERSA